MKKFSIIFDRNIDNSFTFGLTPICLHRHFGETKMHFHFLIEFAFWFLEIQIGDDSPKIKK